MRIEEATEEKLSAMSPQVPVKELGIQVQTLSPALAKNLEADVEEGAVVIDVGITRLLSAETKTGYRLTGDVKFAEVAPKCSFITPVPGGVGPMTIMALMHNTLLASRKSIYNDATYQQA